MKILLKKLTPALDYLGPTVLIIAGIIFASYHLKILAGICIIFGIVLLIFTAVGSRIVKIMEEERHY